MAIKKLITQIRLPQLPENPEEMRRYQEDLLKALTDWQREVVRKINEIVDEVNP